MTGAVDVALVPKSTGSDITAIFERLAANPQVDVEKLGKLIEAHERIMRAQARVDFDAAFAGMQGELPIISKEGAIEVNGQLRSRYARYEDIVECVRPVLAKHGFSFRHRNEFADDGKQRIVGVLSHRSGHSEEDAFVCPPDTSGGKSNIQAIGSTRSYGQRYTLTALLGIATRDADDDGHAAGRQPSDEPAAPEHFDTFLLALESVAQDGTAALTKAFNQASKEFRNHLTGKHGRQWDLLKATAAKVKVTK